MANPYIPTKDQDLAAWAVNFNTLITAAPSTYGLVAGDATAINSFVVTFTAALTVASDPSTKTKTTVAAKDSAKAAMLDIVRGYGQQIAHNNGVTNGDKIALGLNLPNPHKSPIPVPVTFPLLSVVGATPNEHVIRYADSATPDKRAKAPGAIALQLVCSVGTVAPTDPNAMPTKQFVTKQPDSVDFSSGDSGKTAFYYARWITRTGLAGPWSDLTSFIIP